MNDIIIYRP